MSSVEQKPPRLHRVPLSVKIIILGQSAVILAFTVGMYQEYLNNSYLQAYVVGLLSSNIVGDLILSMVTMSVFAIGTFTLLGSMSATRRVSKEWREAPEPLKEEMKMPIMPVLETLDPAPSETRAARPSRTKRARISSDDLFESMTRHVGKHEN